MNVSNQDEKEKEQDEKKKEEVVTKQC